jgi:hypothetical protein
MNTTTMTTAAIAMTAWLAACGGGGEFLDTPQAVADKLGCASTYKDVKTEEIGVDLAGSCRFEGQTVRLLTFASPESQDTFLEIASQFGGRYAEGDGYLVEVKGPEAQQAAEAKLG